MVTADKKTLSLADIDAQTAFELPSRETLQLVNIVVTNVLNNLTVSIPIQNNHVAVEVCAVLNVLNAHIGTNLTCTVTA
jgi:hypothetical protein